MLVITWSPSPLSGRTPVKLFFLRTDRKVTHAQGKGVPLLGWAQENTTTALSQASGRGQQCASVQEPDRRALLHPTTGEGTYETSSGSTYQFKSQLRLQHKRTIPRQVV
eukprot:3066548-Amphidinium_carterae.4